MQNLVGLEIGQKISFSSRTSTSLYVIVLAFYTNWKFLVEILDDDDQFIRNFARVWSDYI